MVYGFSGFATEHRAGVFTLQDYFQEGHARVTEYLRIQATNGASLEKTIAARQRSCVQIEVLQKTGQSHLASMGSASIVGHGMLLLSAGHNFVGMQKHTRVSVLGPEGEKKTARLLDMDYDPEKATDWAILEVEDGGFHPQYATNLARSIKANETVFILGYPQSYGLKKDGQVAHTRSFPKMRLEPLVLVGSVKQRAAGRKLLLNLDSGAIFLPGASGGPVFNQQGELMGVYTSFITEVSLGHVNYTMSMRPFPKALVKMLSDNNNSMN